MRRQRRGKATALCQLIQKTREKLASADSTTWSKEEKNTALECMTGLMLEAQAAIDRV